MDNSHQEQEPLQAKPQQDMSVQKEVSQQAHPRQYTFQPRQLRNESRQNPYQQYPQGPFLQNQLNQQNQFYQQYQQFRQGNSSSRYIVEPDASIPREEINPKKVISRSLFALCIMAIVVLLAQYGIDFGARTFYEDITETDWYLWAITALSVVVIGFPVFFLIMRTVPDSPKRQKVKLKLSHFIVLFFICAGAMYITNFFSVALNMAISLMKGENFMDTGIMDIMSGSNYIVTIIYASIIAPIFEELIFRKLLLNKLRRFGDVPAILITAVAFGLFHMNLSQVFYATTLGIVFAYVTCKTNNILYSIILHMMINSIATAFIPLATSGNLIGSLFILLWVGTAVISGITLFAFNFKHIRLEKGTVAVSKKSTYILNLGAILYFLVCFLMILIQTLMPAA